MGKATEREKRDKGTEKTRARVQYWNAMDWQGGGHGAKSQDAAGLLWLVGLLDGFPVPGEDMLTALEVYEETRRSQYGASTAPAANYIPRSRTTGDGMGNIGAMLLFDKLDYALRQDRAAWQAVQSLLFDAPFCQDTELGIPHWVQRIVDKERRDKGYATIGRRTPSVLDRQRLEAAIRGMSAMAEAMGGRRKAA